MQQRLQCHKTQSILPQAAFKKSKLHFPSLIPNEVVNTLIVIPLQIV